MKLICLVFVGLLCVWDVRSDTPFDSVVDEIIFESSQDLIKNGQTEVMLPEINQKFSTKVLFFQINGALQVQGASVGNLSTIYRIGDVTPTLNNSTLSIQGTFGLKDLTIRANLFDFKASIIHIHDPLVVSVTKNSATFNVSLIRDEHHNCTTKLNMANVGQIGGFKVSLGSGLVSDLENEIATFAMNRLSSTIQNAINSQIFPIVSNAIQNIDLCSKIPF